MNASLKCLVIALILLLLIGYASAAGDKSKDTKKVASHSYKHVEVNGIIEAIKSLLGMDVKENYYEVVIDGSVVAEIPEDSALLNITVHESCLPPQYGTKAWYDCEVSLQ